MPSFSDLLAVAAVGLLLYRLQEDYMKRRQEAATVSVSGTDEREGDDKSDVKAGSEAIRALELQGKALAGGQDPVALGLFGYLLVYLLFLGSLRSSASPGADEAAILTVDLNVGGAAVSRLLEADADKQQLLAVLSLQAPDGSAPDSAFAKAEAMTVTFLHKMDASRLQSVVVGTRAAGDYGPAHLGVDSAVARARSSGLHVVAVHVLGDLDADVAFASMRKCLGAPGAVECEAIVEGDAQACLTGLNSRLRSAMLVAAAASGKRINDAHAQPVLKAAAKAGIDLSPEPLVAMAETEVDAKETSALAAYERRRAAAEEDGPGVTKRVVLWLTRVLAFVYPASETYHALVERRGVAASWRAYWTIFAGLHVMEDALFMRLVYLLPVYMIAKLVFVVWCVFPDPSNSAMAYNAVFNLMSRAPRE